MSLRAVPRSCDHDGKASGRLVLEANAVRRELVCDCGEVLAVLGRDQTTSGWAQPALTGAAAPARRAATR